MKTDKALYRRLRDLSPEALWEEAGRFDRAEPAERMRGVAVIRAIGVAFARGGTPERKAEVRAWLVGLLQDPSEKVRRYAMAALPKMGAGDRAEGDLISLLQTTTVEREKKFVGRALGKIGGKATLHAVEGARALPLQAEQKVRASVARRERPSAIRMDRVLDPATRMRIHLRCRRGLEEILRDEAQEVGVARGKFRVVEMRRGLVAMAPRGPFSLGDLYAMRCFGSVGFVLGAVKGRDPAQATDALAEAITSALARRILDAFTEGSIRYRLDFVSKGHQRGAVHRLANRVYELCPTILNDARSAPWSMDIGPEGDGMSVELRPRLSPDPRWFYRRDDVPAASHPPLAACMARLAGKMRGEVVWDPFCGSGLELIERALRGGVDRLYGTDLSPEAIAVARANVDAAGLTSTRSEFACCDFRDIAKGLRLGPETVTLVITNPPMGRRVRIRDMQGLFRDLFVVAAAVLRPGGRLVFANPLRLEPEPRSLKLHYRQTIDLGGFDCRLEMYVKRRMQ